MYQHIQINIQTRQAKNIRGANSIRCTCIEHDPNNTISIEKPITGDNV